MRVFGKGFNYSEDGPGNRLVYHVAGCNMRCIWCSNPEGMNASAGREVSPCEILAESISCTPMFFDGGGITFTGGEATLFSCELTEVLKLLKGVGIHTAIETNGTCEKLQEILRYVDYLIMDFKHYDTEAHEKYTGIDNGTVKANFEANCKTGRRQHIRIPLINGINTAHPERFAEYFSAFDTTNTVFEILPYHEYGKDKWTEPYLVKDGFIGADTLEKFKETFKKYNLKIIET